MKIQDNHKNYFGKIIHWQLRQIILKFVDIRLFQQNYLLAKKFSRTKYVGKKTFQHKTIFLFEMFLRKVVYSWIWYLIPTLLELFRPPLWKTSLSNNSKVDSWHLNVGLEGLRVPPEVAFAIRCWPSFSLSSFFIYVYCFGPTSGILPKVKSPHIFA